MHLSDLQSKDIVCVKNGKKIGNIIDVTIDDKGYMKSLIIQKNRFTLFRSDNDNEIKWNQIRKIGEDVILVDIDI